MPSFSSSRNDICRKMALVTFYHGNINREESEKRLRAYVQENQCHAGGLCYLVRKTDQTCYVLSVIGNDSGANISHFIITQTSDNRLKLGELYFFRISELVTFFSKRGKAKFLQNQWLEYPVPMEQLQTEDNNCEKPLSNEGQDLPICFDQLQMQNYDNRIKDNREAKKWMSKKLGNIVRLKSCQMVQGLPALPKTDTSFLPANINALLFPPHNLSGFIYDGIIFQILKIDADFARNIKQILR